MTMVFIRKHKTNKIEEEDAEEILRIVKEQQLITRVKEYEELPTKRYMILMKSYTRSPFAFADGSTIDARSMPVMSWFMGSINLRNGSEENKTGKGDSRCLR